MPDRPALPIARALEALLASGETATLRALRDLPIDYFRATLEGIENLPSEGGALLVGNHAYTGVDGIVLGALVLRERRRRVRFLGDRNLWRIPVLRDVLDGLGAVPGEPEAAVSLLAAGELVGVYPGGVDDSFKDDEQKYRLQWGQRAGFAKVAMRAGVPIVPVAAFGIDEMYTVVGRERWLGRALFGSRRYDLPIAFGAYGTPLPRRHPQRFVVLPPIATDGEADDPVAVERVRAAAFDALDAKLAEAR